MERNVRVIDDEGVEVRPMLNLSTGPVPATSAIPVDPVDNLCPFCGKLLFRGTLAPGSRIRCKCHASRCRRLVTVARM